MGKTDLRVWGHGCRKYGYCYEGYYFFTVSIDTFNIITMVAMIIASVTILLYSPP